MTSKPTYGNIKPATGAMVTGNFHTLLLIPKEWLQTKIIPDFDTNVVNTSVSLTLGKTAIEIKYTEDSIVYDEKPKGSKSGSFIENSVSGLSNNIEPAILQTLETLRYHEFVVIIKDRQKRNRILGNKDFGAVLQYSQKSDNKAGGTYLLSIDLQMQTENPAPFYLS